MKLLLIGLVCGLILFYKCAQYLSLPTYSQTVYTTTLKNDVKIFRDEYGIPHIHANSRKDAIFGLGFVLAQDRLWQLHMRRLAAKNQLHRVLGEAALNFDQFIATVDYMDSCKRIVNKLDDVARELLQSYADGINQGRKSLTMLPIEFQLVNADFPDWEIIDTVAFIKLQTLIMSNDYHIEMMRSTMLEEFGLEITNLITGIGGRNLYNSQQSAISKEEFKESSLYQPQEQQQYQQQYRPEGKDLLKESEVLEDILPKISGSNAWVIHGNFTTTGFPILASDPHLDNAMPSQWYQVEMNYKTDFIIGGCMVGTPLILSGRSKYHAWGITILYSDTTDLYEEQLKEINGKIHYLFKNEWLPTIEKSALNMTIHRTHHGPILNMYFDDRGSKQFVKPQKHYSLQSLVDKDDIENIGAFFKMIDEPILGEGLKHLKKVIYPSLAMVFASNQDIAYMPLGKLVIRDSHPDSHGYIKNGWEGLQEWTGLLSEEEHPIFVNPKKGYFSTANNRFFPDDDKHHFSWNVNPTARALQIDRVLSEQIKKKISIEQTRQLQLDETDSYLFDTLQQLLDLLDTDNKQQQQFNETLYIWDCVFNEKSTQATLYSLFEHYYLKTFIHLPQRFYKIYVFDTFHFKNLLQFDEKSVWCKKQSCLQNLRDAVQQAVLHYNSLSDQRFSEIKTQYYPHQPMVGKLFGFFDREIKHGGNRRSIRVSGFDSTQLPFRGNTGSNYRMIVSMRPGDISQYILDTGISGNVLSQHYDDQMELWRVGQYLPMQIKYQKNQLTLLKSNITKSDL